MSNSNVLQYEYCLFYYTRKLLQISFMGKYCFIIFNICFDITQYVRGLTVLKIGAAIADCTNNYLEILQSLYNIFNKVY